MKKRSKLLSKVICLALILTMCIGTYTVHAASTSWNFKNSEFKNLNTIKSTVTVDGLSLIATSSKTMSVKSKSETLDGTKYTYCLALNGAGSTSYRAVKVPVSGKSTIKVVLKSSSSSKSRSIVVADDEGSKLTTLTAKTSVSLQSYTYTGSSNYVYLYSSNGGINIYKIQVDSSSDSTDSGSTDSGSTIVVKNGGTSLETAISKAKSGTTIVVNGTVKSGKVTLPAGVNIKGENSAVIDFSSTSAKRDKGISMPNDGSTISNITIKNAGDNGIYVTGSNNTFEYVETCYNSDTGIQVSNGGANNKFYNCYSHHNADSSGENADGYAVKLHSGEGNYFENCKAEYNSDDGWDFYAAHGAVTLVGCEANYNGNCNGIKGDGNGFKLGGVDNKTDGVAAHLDPLKHKLINCSAKGNTNNGFDRNNQNGVITMTGCVAESNGKYNFNFPLTGTPSALGYKVTFGKAIMNDCTSIDGSNSIKGATITNSKGF